MGDATKAAVEWIRAQLQNDTRAVARSLLAHLDGEPERIAAAREEQREACARVVKNAVTRYDHGDDADEKAVHEACIDECRATPLTATPLADRLAAAEARVADRGDRAERIIRERDEVVAALRALLPEVYGAHSPPTVGYAIDRHRIIAQARAVLAKHPEGKR